MRILYSIILCIFFFAQTANAWMMPGLVSQQDVVSGGTCSATSLSSTVDEDYGSAATNSTQDVGYSGPALDICKITAKLWVLSGPNDVKVEIWSDLARAGTKYAESDADNTITDSSNPGSVYSWDITTTTPPTGRFYVHLVSTSGSGSLKVKCQYTDLTNFGGSAYLMYDDGVVINRDMYMTVHANE